MSDLKVYKGTSWGITFDVGNALALDSRQVCNNFAEVHSTERWNEGTESAPVFSVYPGMITSSLADSSVYMYIGGKNSAADIADAGKWLRLASVEDIRSGLASALVYRGSVESLSALDAKVNPSIGDLWNMNQVISGSITVNSDGDTQTVKDGDTVEIESSGSPIEVTVHFDKFTAGDGSVVYYIVPVDSSGYFYTPAGNSWMKSSLYTAISSDDYEHAGFPEGTGSGDYDIRIQGMNYACIGRYAMFKNKKVYEGDSFSGGNTSGETVSGTVYFNDGYAYVKVVSGTNTQTCFFDQDDEVLVTFTSYSATTQTAAVYGDWDAQGTTLTNIPTKDELTSGTLIPAAAIKLAAMHKIDGVGFNGTGDIAHYTTCSTAAATSAKVASLSNFGLSSGSRVFVKFTYANTASSPTLQVNSTGAKSIKKGSAVFTDIEAGIVYQFVYDGSAYQLVGSDKGVTTAQGKVLGQFASVKTDDTTVSGYASPYEIDLKTWGSEGSRSAQLYVIYKQMVADFNNGTQMKGLKFLLYDNRKCKFDIESYTSGTGTVVFSFICNGCFYRGKLTTESGATSSAINWSTEAADLGSMYSTVGSLSSSYTALQQSVETLDSRTKWYSLD